ncbi:hypothetical protein ACFQRL_09930 [Microbacterium fluvii]|uniref:DUF3618 domain-containing protein n=1 Tax=Microbacterium fluvii TaxID=415215 RepID=A0ABW2HD59_9MICO|nr:hypothetical protein [Microbacterium fluvii]MCU4672910.1 hypothetical protein [Microbacterium fluvii]
MSSDAPVPTPRTAVPLGITDPVERARAELKAALAAIEQKGNLPRRAGRAIDRQVEAAQRFSRRQPVLAASAVVAVAATVGGLVWLAVKAFTD